MLAHEKQIKEYEKTLIEVKEQNKINALWSDEEIEKLEKKLEQLKKKVYSELTPWQRVLICRHTSRPRAIDYIATLCKDFTELFGDRLYRDDRSIITGLCRIGNVKFLVIAQEKGCDTESRLYRNFGSPYPEGYRKALRCMRLAEKFKLPVLSLIDTPGAFAGLAAEERGQGWAIAQNLSEMARLKTPIIIVLIGEGCSGGALGIGVGDRIAMLEHSFYSVISPEGCASILWKDAQKKELAAAALKMFPENLLSLGIIDTIIDEPQGGAHYDPDSVYQDVKEYILREWEQLKNISPQALLEQRYQKFRQMGKFILEEKPPV
ncbi:MAG TPA: acetyl-CoA carboxylase carboxyltransferase subunit alpha [Rhabdochlamydiaceae bacterium]|nr:acetyl-CoA carboxylase carboxyltransferase subunit alpha [Rhabdochlamydiaceae bacterium]